MTHPSCRYPTDQNLAQIATDLRDGSTARAIDVHAHYLPPKYRARLLELGITKPDGYAAGLREWSASAHLDVLGRLGIEFAILSVTSPGVHVTDDPTDAVRLARTANDEGAEIAARNQDRFGWFAALPLPDVEAAVEEVRYALDEQGAWGVCLLTHTAGTYLGDPAIEPLMAELSRRRARVLIHPTQPACLVPDVMAGWSRSMYEFFFDTTRAVINLVFAGTLARNPGIELIVPHAGAVLPALAQRIERNVWAANRRAGSESIPDFIESLRSFWFDLAGSPEPYQLPSLLALVGADRLLYGSDWPFTGVELGTELTAEIRSTALLDLADRTAALRGNAHKLFPRLEEVLVP